MEWKGKLNNTPFFPKVEKGLTLVIDLKRYTIKVIFHLYFFIVLNIEKLTDIVGDPDKRAVKIGFKLNLEKKIQKYEDFRRSKPVIYLSSLCNMFRSINSSTFQNARLSSFFSQRKVEPKQFVTIDKHNSRRGNCMYHGTLIHDGSAASNILIIGKMGQAYPGIDFDCYSPSYHKSK
ncbi:hypothetical protein ACTFIZ_012678 [Dictyostelium cf. discoideum]